MICVVHSTDIVSHIFKRASMKGIFKNKYVQVVLWIISGAVICFGVVYTIAGLKKFSTPYTSGTKIQVQSGSVVPPPVVPVFNTTAYDTKMLALANIPPPPVSKVITNAKGVTIPPKPRPAPLWPVKGPYPLVGALLPFNRIVAYYGNFYSTKMGILGQYPPDEMLLKLQAVVAQWKAADPTTPVIPAIDYIAVTAQGTAGADGKYRARMPADQIQKAIDLAAQVNGIVILDIQDGGSNVQTEIPLLEPYLKLPQVELALDPEFSMKNGKRPGTVIGTMDAVDINWTAKYLATLVKQYNIPPKVLIVHRFTEDMVTNYQNIMPLPEVQIVMDMDGWSTPDKKIHIYDEVIQKDPVQFAGIKLFYKNDIIAPSNAMLTPTQILQLSPQPIFIQYQ